MIKQVYETMKADHTKGDFFDLVKKDMEELDIDFIDEEIQTQPKTVEKIYPW